MDFYGDNELDKRLSAIEARLLALVCVGGFFALLMLINLGVSLWYFQQNPKPDWDFIAVTLTIFEIFLVIALIGGFWMLRSAAQEAARAEARKIVPRVAERDVRRNFLDWQNFTEPLEDNEEDSTSVQDMVDSFSEDDEDGA